MGRDESHPLDPRCIENNTRTSGFGVIHYLGFQVSYVYIATSTMDKKRYPVTVSSSESAFAIHGGYRFPCPWAKQCSANDLLNGNSTDTSVGHFIFLIGGSWLASTALYRYRHSQQNRAKAMDRAALAIRGDIASPWSTICASLSTQVQPVAHSCGSKLTLFWCLVVKTSKNIFMTYQLRFLADTYSKVW